METVNNYLEYRSHKGEYENWEKEKNTQEAKRIAYIKRNGIDEKQRQEDIARAKAVLNAVDIMDEYSQTRAEDTEMAIQQISGIVTQVASTLLIPLLFLGLYLAGKNDKLRGMLENGFEKILNIAQTSKGKAGLIGAGISIIGLATVPIIAKFATWSCKKELQASRNGRYEAMTSDLASAKQFAVLTKEQQEERDKIAKTIEIEEKDQKSLVNTNKQGFAPINTLKEIFIKNDELEKERKDFAKKLENDESKFNTIQLTQEEINEAKKDKQLIENIVKKVDIASQEYAENVELVTGGIQTIALGGGLLNGFLSSKIMSKLKLSSKYTKIISCAIGLATTLAFAIYSTKLQKEASRVARFKVKQELLNNPESLIYVEESKTQNEKTDVIKKEKKGFFETFKEIIENQKEYKKYVKENIVEIKQKQKALEKIEITPEQEKRARQLQRNVFKMFNKVDEKSQKYSESTEALGDIATTISSFAAMGASALGASKIIDNVTKSSKISFKNIGAINILKSVIPLLVSIGFNIYITKEQKNASKVADMIAINEMDDYRHFADYSNKTPRKNDETETKTTFSSSDITPPWKK